MRHFWWKRLTGKWCKVLIRCEKAKERTPAERSLKILSEDRYVTIWSAAANAIGWTRDHGCDVIQSKSAGWLFFHWCNSLFLSLVYNNLQHSSTDLLSWPEKKLVFKSLWYVDTFPFIKKKKLFWPKHCPIKSMSISVNQDAFLCFYYSKPRPSGIKWKAI